MEGREDFSKLLSQAASMRGKMDRNDRREFEKQPRHVRHTLFHCFRPLEEDNLTKDNELERNGIETRLQIALNLKQKANEKFSDDLSEATDLYERALGQFEYYRFIDDKFNDLNYFKKTGIKDNQIKLTKCNFSTVNSDVVIDIQELQATCLSNLALCSLKVTEKYNKIDVNGVNVRREEMKECLIVCDKAMNILELIYKDYIKSDAIKASKREEDMKRWSNLKSKILFRRSFANYELFIIKQNGYNQNEANKHLSNALEDVKASLFEVPKSNACKQLLKELLDLRKQRINEKKKSFFNFDKFLSKITPSKDDDDDDFSKQLESLKAKSRKEAASLKDEANVYRSYAVKCSRENREKDAEDLIAAAKKLELRVTELEELANEDIALAMKNKTVDGVPAEVDNSFSFSAMIRMDLGNFSIDYILLFGIIYFALMAYIYYYL